MAHKCDKWLGASAGGQYCNNNATHVYVFNRTLGGPPHFRCSIHWRDETKEYLFMTIEEYEVWQVQEG